MATAISVKVSLTGFDKLSHFRDKLERLRDFNLVVGIRLLTGMSNRLINSYATGAGVHRTGRLLKSLQINAPGGHSEITERGGSVGSNVEYAAQQDQGGPIVPKPPGKFLAIPIPLALKRTNENWPRDIDPGRKVLRFIPSDDDGGAVLVDDEGILGYGKGILYKLVRRVVHEPKHLTRVEQDEITAIETVDWPRFLET